VSLSGSVEKVSSSKGYLFMTSLSTLHQNWCSWRIFVGSMMYADLVEAIFPLFRADASLVKVNHYYSNHAVAGLYGHFLDHKRCREWGGIDMAFETTASWPRGTLECGHSSVRLHRPH
jgi:hypothetical protein